MSVKELKGITPTFQGVLNKQIGKAMDAIDDRDYERAYEVICTLIDALKEGDSDKFLNNDIAHIEAELDKAMQHTEPSLHQTWLRRASGTKSVLRAHVRGLFRKVMRKLHEGGYLELRRAPVETNVPPEFFDQATR